MTEQQEKDVLEKCVELATRLIGKKPVGYRAPLYQIGGSNIKLLVDNGFSYGASSKNSYIYILHHTSQLTTAWYRRLPLCSRLQTISCPPRYSNPFP